MLKSKSLLFLTYHGSNREERKKTPIATGVGSEKPWNT